MASESVLAAIDRLHARAVRSRLLLIFTALTRVMLALAFLPSGLVKVRGERFTTLPVTDPVGYFFDAFFSAPGYYRFVGAMQLTAVVLLLIPRTAPLGAVIYLPIVLNIFVITVAVGFGNTAVITGLMLLANVYLICWEYDRWKALLPSTPGSPHLPLWQTLALGAAAFGGFTGITQLHLARLRHADMTQPMLLVLLAGSAGMLMLWVSWSRSRSS